jgi:DNA polymerase I-like protein with 3'-5' exonuclease and polymerase domains
LISSDFSAQEPRLLAHMSGDQELIHAFKEGKDLYAHIGNLALKVPYEQCLEHNPDGSVNPEGKKRRTKMKAIVLALMYGKGARALAEDLKITLDEAKDLMNAVFTEFPKVKQFIDNSQTFAKTYGYVKTNWGRKRRLPDMMLDKYEYSYVNGIGNDFDPLGDFSTPVETTQEVKPELKAKWNKLLDRAWGFKQKQALVERARQEDGLSIKDNGMKIADSERQTVNSRIQGSAGDMTKLASQIIFKDKRLIERDCHILIWVHDEIIATCPIKYAQECAKFIQEDMVKSGAELDVPMKTDVEITKIWYGEELKF